MDTSTIKLTGIISRLLEHSSWRLSWREETSTSSRLSGPLSSSDGSWDPCNLKMLLTKWLMSSEDISQEKEKKIKEKKKIQRNSKKNHSPTNMIKAIREGESKAITKEVRSPIGALKKVFEKKEQWREQGSEKKTNLGRARPLKSLGALTSSLASSLWSS